MSDAVPFHGAQLLDGPTNVDDVPFHAARLLDEPPFVEHCHARASTLRDAPYPAGGFDTAARVRHEASTPPDAERAGEGSQLPARHSVGEDGDAALLARCDADWRGHPHAAAAALRELAHRSRWREWCTGAPGRAPSHDGDTDAADTDAAEDEDELVGARSAADIDDDCIVRGCQGQVDAQYADPIRSMPSGSLNREAPAQRAARLQWVQQCVGGRVAHGLEV
ncbi:hypothetical protein AB1Y20_008577 [Prymnesium parvum]|uniref:Uncharacterized protein n=1 Tax=Prymnesium parvum TaxID=97485 RepID=A0AB34IUB8_PRYPA